MEANINKKVVRSIDLGYGFTKFIQNVTDKGDVKPVSFPSVASIAGKKNLGGGFFAERDTITVKHEGVFFEVGKDALLAAGGYGNRPLNRDYTSSNDYAVLMKGALKMMNLTSIDNLILGAPVNNYSQVKKSLKTSWEGIIELDDERKIKINKVTVLPQPLGGFNWHIKNLGTGAYEKLKQQRSLIIDPGHFTFDWLVTQNMKMLEGSNSHEGGMSFVIKEIANEVCNGANDLTVLSRIDEYFYNDKPFLFKGKEVDLSKHLKVANTVISKSVQSMLNSLGNTNNVNNIDNIIMIGGAAEIYLPHVQKIFEGRDVHISKGKSFANVMGFQWIGEAISNGKRMG